MAVLTMDYGSSVCEHLPDFLVAFEDSIRRRLTVMCPCRVVDYDRVTHKIRVQPLVREVMAGADNGTDAAEIICTAWRFSCGRFIIDLPILKGDVGWVIAADSDTDQVKSRCSPPEMDSDRDGRLPGTQNPGTGLNHSLQHGLFIPDMWNRLSLYSGDGKTEPSSTFNPDPGRLTIQSIDGQQRISLGTQGGSLTVNVNAANEVNVVTTKAGSSVNVRTKKVNIVADQSISEKTTTSTEEASAKTVVANVTIKGNLTVEGQISVPNNDVMVGTVSLKRHIHSGVTGGTGTSGQPVQ